MRALAVIAKLAYTEAMRTAKKFGYRLDVAQIRHEIPSAFVAQSLIGLSTGYSEMVREQVA